MVPDEMDTHNHNTTLAKQTDAKPGQVQTSLRYRTLHCARNGVEQLIHVITLSAIWTSSFHSRSPAPTKV